jgi:hypothetical protein
VNKNKNSTGHLSLIKKVDLQHKDPMLLNLDELEVKSGFTRNQLIKIIIFNSTQLKVMESIHPKGRMSKNMNILYLTIIFNCASFS